jgi:hypothetical protein
VKACIIGVVILCGIPGAVLAQDAQAVGDQQFLARQRIFRMERSLETAVALGVDSLKRQLRPVMPDDTLLLAGAPEARGFRLEGYGFLFDVEVPGLRPSMAWSLRTMNQSSVALAQDLAQMRRFVQSLPDQRLKLELDRTLQRIQQQVGPVARVPEVAQGGVGAQGSVTAQSVPTGTVVSQAAASPETSSTPADSQLLVDPSEAYTREVKTALIDTMIEYGGSLTIADDEWLTVAARDNVRVDRFIAADPSEVVTIVLRIKGSDLAAYRAGRLTLEQARARVLTSES